MTVCFLHISSEDITMHGRIGGGGVQGVRTIPFLAHVVGFLTLGPKLDPLLEPPVFACRPQNKMPPLFKKSWIRPCYSQFCGVISIHSLFFKVRIWKRVYRSSAQYKVPYRLWGRLLRACLIIYLLWVPPVQSNSQSSPWRQPLRQFP